MSEQYVCMKCKCAGAKSLIPYKLIEDRDGESIKFKGQLCERCFNELMAPTQSTKEEDDESSKV